VIDPSKFKKAPPTLYANVRIRLSDYDKFTLIRKHLGLSMIDLQAYLAELGTVTNGLGLIENSQVSNDVASDTDEPNITNHPDETTTSQLDKEDSHEAK